MIGHSLGRIWGTKAPHTIRDAVAHVVRKQRAVLHHEIGDAIAVTKRVALDLIVRVTKLVQCADGEEGLNRARGVLGQYI